MENQDEVVTTTHWIIRSYKPGSIGGYTRQEEDDDLDAKVHSAILLSLGDEVLREVAEETTALAFWNRLEGLYLKKSLANRLYLKKSLYTIHMEESKDLRKTQG